MIDAVKRYLGGSLARQLVLGIVVVQTVLISLFVFDLVSREAATLSRNRMQRAEGVAEMLATNGVSWMLSEDLRGLDELTRSAAAFDGLRYAMFLSPSGRVLAHSDPDVAGTFVSDEIGRSLLRGPPALRRLASTSEAVDVAMPILSTTNGRHIGWAWISLSRADVVSDTRSAGFKGVLYVILATALAALMSALLAASIGRGLGEVARVSARFRGGDRKVRVREERYDEVGDVGRGLNAMLDTIVETENWLQTTQQIARIGSWRCDLNTGSLRWSHEVYVMFGLDPAGPPPTLEQFIGALPSEGREQVEAVLDPSKPKARFTFLLPITRADGTQRVCWTEGRSEFDAERRLSALVGVCQDVTERESSAAQLRQAQKMEAVGQLTGGLAHDFNNLLSIIVGNLDFIEGELEPDAPAREFSQTALEAALKGSQLTQQLLAFSRRQPLAPKVIDINALVSNMTALMTRTIGEDIAVRLVRAQTALPTRADPSQIESAVLNLVINARDAMPSGGVLTIETSAFTVGPEEAESHPDALAGDYSVVSVSDTGHGMSPDVVAKVFEPFFSTKAVGKGSGLGLSMIYGFAKQSGGHVGIYSEPGHGTTVRLFLPAATELAAGVDPGSSDRGLPRARNEKVLVVEDNPDVRRIAARQLRELGYSIIEAENGPAALEVLLAEPDIDLLFTDVVMPGGMSGMELVETARQRRPELKVLYTTGFTEAAADTSGGFTGSDLLISKPYRKADLALRLREVLEAA